MEGHGEAKLSKPFLHTSSGGLLQCQGQRHIRRNKLFRKIYVIGKPQGILSPLGGKGISNII
jgi:hypothetical protein